MTAKRFLMACALAMTFGSVGCQHWCERHYPCPNQAPAYAAPAPCCPQASYAPPPPPSTWAGSAPPPGAMNCTCVPRQ